MPKTQTKRKLSPRELDALRERLRKEYAAEHQQREDQKQRESENRWRLANDIASDINDTVGRGVVAPIAGAFGDINQLLWDAGAWVNNKIKDVEYATGMVKQPRYVQPSQGNAYLGSEDIGNRLERAGLVSSERRPMIELAASLISPGAAAKSVINTPKTAMNALRMAENSAATSRGIRTADGIYIPRGQMGAMDLGMVEAPQSKALREAQINAAKPVSEGGLGLRADNTPDERAAAMGFEDNWYHGRYRDYEQIDPNKTFYSTQDPSYASIYAAEPTASSMGGKSKIDYENLMPNVMPVMIRRSDVLDTRLPEGKKIFDQQYFMKYGNGTPLTDKGIPDWVEAEDFAEMYADNGINYKGVFVDEGKVPTWGGGLRDRGVSAAIFDPSAIRSRFAAFDPMRRDSSDLLAGLALPVVAAPVVSESNKKKRKDKKK